MHTGQLQIRNHKQALERHVYKQDWHTGSMTQWQLEAEECVTSIFDRRLLEQQTVPVMGM